MIKLLQISQWLSMGVYDFPIVRHRKFFWINTDLRIDPNSIPYIVNSFLLLIWFWLSSLYNFVHFLQ